MVLKKNKKKKKKQFNYIQLKTINNNNNNNNLHSCLNVKYSVRCRHSWFPRNKYRVVGWQIFSAHKYRTHWKYHQIQINKWTDAGLWLSMIKAQQQPGWSWELMSYRRLFKGTGWNFNHRLSKLISNFVCGINWIRLLQVYWIKIDSVNGYNMNNPWNIF